jgi:pimeloyl-ACP methyl ester carboxylesterase
MRVAFSQLSQRVILVWGKQDTTTPITKASALLALNPTAELEVFDFCRVMPEQEHPELFNALVKDVFAMSAKAKKLGS